MSFWDNLAQIGSGILKVGGGIVTPFNPAIGAGIAGLGEAWSSADNYFLAQNARRQAMRREDNAVYRHTRDMARSGFNPIFAGPGSASSVAASNVPRGDVSGINSNALGALRGLSDIRHVDADTALKGQQEAEISMRNKVYALDHALDLNAVHTLMGALSNLSQSDAVVHATNKVAAQNAMAEGERARAEAVSQLVAAGLDKAKAEALAAGYGADIAKIHLEVSGATKPAMIAAPYADIGAKVVGAGTTMSLNRWLGSWLEKNRPE